MISLGIQRMSADLMCAAPQVASIQTVVFAAPGELIV
jgi:hypothetical protein